MKKALKKVLHRAILTYDELHTLLVEAEGIVNSRPLVYVSEESMETITPAHFLILQRITRPADAERSEVQMTIPVRLRRIQESLNRLWITWKEEYIKSLRERPFSQKRGTFREPEVGEIVLIEDKVPRFKWKLGRVESMRRGRDGIVRSVSVRVASRDQSVSSIRRPVRALVTLETFS